MTQRLVTLARQLRTASPLLLLAALAGQPALAAAQDGLYIETINRSSGLQGEEPREETSKTYVAHDKMKVVTSSQQGAEMILDPAAGTMTFLNHATKEYYQVDVASMKEGMSKPKLDQMRQMMEQTKISVEPLGETRQIGDWNCQGYKVTKSGMMSIDQTIWATEDVAVDVERYNRMMSLSGPDGLIADTEAGKAQEAEMAKIKGYPILTQTKMQLMGSNMESETQVVAIRHEPMEASFFAIPQDYAKRDMHTMHTPPAGSAGHP